MWSQTAARANGCKFRSWQAWQDLANARKDQQKTENDRAEDCERHAQPPTRFTRSVRLTVFGLLACARFLQFPPNLSDSELDRRRNALCGLFGFGEFTLGRTLRSASGFNLRRQFPQTLEGRLLVIVIGQTR